MTQECKRDAFGDFCTQSLVNVMAVRGYLGPGMQNMMKVSLQVLEEEFDPSFGQIKYSVAKVSF